MYADASVLCTIRHINLSVDPGVRYLIGAPTISARASIQIDMEKENDGACNISDS